MKTMASRRMWSRRFLRAGWLIAPVFAIPATMWNWFRNIRWRDIDWSFVIFLLIMSTFIGAFAFLLHRDGAKFKPADPAELRAAAKADQCIGQQIANRLGAGTVIKRYEFKHFESHCEDARAVQEQIKAIQ